MKKSAFARYASLFLLVALIGIGLLYIAGLFPQEKVHQNIVLSAAQFEAEGEYPQLLNLWSDVYKLDAFSESLMINHTYYMDTAKEPLSMIENLAFRNKGHPVSCLLELAENPNLSGNTERAHYWLGFRAYLRPLLSFMPYQDIRGILSLIFFALMSAAMLTLRDQAGTTVALCFMITILFMNPVVISTSLQYSCCFLIAFVGICLVGRLKNLPKSTSGLFMVLGQATMFFDFYTAPIITWGLPLVALLAIHRKEQKSTLHSAFHLLLTTLGMWCIGYVGMWLFKMILNTLLANQNGFSIIKQFFYYTGITPTPEALPEFTALEALFSCLKKVFSLQNRLALFILVPVFIGYQFYTHRKHGLRVTDNSIWGYAGVMVLPVIWILCSRQASGGHAYFQYRMLAASVFAGLCFAVQLFESRKKA